MTDRQAQLRNSKAKERQAKRDAGLVRVEMWVPAHMADQVKEVVAEMSEPLRLSDETMRGIMSSANKAAKAQDEALAAYLRDETTTA